MKTNSLKSKKSQYLSRCAYGCTRLIWRQSTPSGISAACEPLPRRREATRGCSLILDDSPTTVSISLQLSSRERLFSVAYPAVLLYVGCSPTSYSFFTAKLGEADQGEMQSADILRYAQDLRLDDDSPTSLPSLLCLSRADATSTAARCPWCAPHATAMMPFAFTAGTPTLVKARCLRELLLLLNDEEPRFLT